MDVKDNSHGRGSALSDYYEDLDKVSSLAVSAMLADSMEQMGIESAIKDQMIQIIEQTPIRAEALFSAAHSAFVSGKGVLSHKSESGRIWRYTLSYEAETQGIVRVTHEGDVPFKIIRRSLLALYG